MSEVRSTWKCHWVLILIVTLMVSGLVNIITISLLGAWECPKDAIQAQEVHDVHRNVGLITINESLGDNLAWTILEILALIALIIFSISLAWKAGAFSLGR